MRNYNEKKRMRDDYIKVAKELGYPSTVIEKLKKANTDVTCQNIMLDARHGKY